MLEWKVFNEEPLPEEPEEPPRSPRAPWVQRALLIGVLLIAGGALSRFLGQQDTRLREDLTEVVLVEERALRVGAVEQAPELADPTAPPDWQLRYEATFQPLEASLPLPQVEQVEFSGDIALVTLTHETEDSRWQSVRAYRLVEGQWRRTPVPAYVWGTPKLYTSTHFSLWISDRDAALLPPQELLRFLEQFYLQFALLWPVEPGERSVTIRLEPRDLAPVLLPAPTEQQPLRLTSPLTTHYGYTLAGPPARSYHYEVAAAVAEQLDLLAITEGYRNPDETALRVRLREALVRHILLSAEEQTRFREEIRRLQAGQYLPDGQLSIPTTVFLADYLVASQGPEALATLSLARLRSVDLPSAMIHAFGIPLEEMLVEVRLWMERSAGAKASPMREGRRRATLLRLLKGEPFEAMLLLEESGELLHYRSNEEVRLPVHLPCLGLGSELSFRPLSEQGPDMVGEALRLDVHRLPSLVARPLPGNASLLISRQVNNRNELLALDGQLGQESSLFTFERQTEIVVDPHQARFAYFYQDRCGPGINQHIPGESYITRTPVALQGKGYLLYARDHLYLLDDAPQGEDLHWRVSPVHPWQVGEAIEFTIPEAQGLERIVGYDEEAGRYLLRLRNGQLLWLDLDRAELSEAAIELPPEAEIKSLSPDGRWLAYTVATNESASILLGLDLEGGEPLFLYQYSSTAFGEVVWSPTSTLNLMTRVGVPIDDRVVGNGLLPLKVNSNSDSPLYLDGQIDQLHWCPDGSLYYRLTRESHTVIATGPQAKPRELTRNAEIVGCIGSP